MGSPLPFWPSEKQAGKPLHPAHFERPKECKRCGKHFLFWRRLDGEWKLHHFADLNDGKGAHYVLHRCGFTSAGEPIAATQQEQTS